MGHWEVLIPSHSPATIQDAAEFIPSGNLRAHPREFSTLGTAVGPEGIGEEWDGY